MKRWLLALGVAGLLLLILCLLRDRSVRATAAGANPPAAAAPFVARRIVSLAPSITETLYALGLGDRVVGVTRYCLYPPEAREKADVGGYLDPNYEALLAQEPDLVVVLEDHRQAREYLARLGRRTLAVDHTTVDGILASILRLGAAGGCPCGAEALAADIRRRMAVIAEKTAEAGRPSVLFCAGRAVGSGSLDEVYITGRGGFYDELLTLAGGTNVYDGPLPYPAISAEGILRMDPDVVIDVVADPEGRPIDAAAVRAEWDALPSLAAVRAGRVYVMTNDYAVIPGPRFIRTLEDMARCIHPELEWE